MQHLEAQLKDELMGEEKVQISNESSMTKLVYFLLIKGIVGGN